MKLNPPPRGPGGSNGDSVMSSGPVTVLPPLPMVPATAMLGPALSSGPSPLLTVTDNVLQHKRLFLGLLLLALAVGALHLLISPPVYRADTLLQIQPRSARSLTNPQPQASFSSEMPQGYILGEMEILRSREIIAKAVQQTQSNLDVRVANRFPVIGGWYARRHARAGTTEPLPPPLELGLLHRYAWGGESLRVARFEVPHTRYGKPFTLTLNDKHWSLSDEDDKPLAQGEVGAPAEFRVDGEPAMLHVTEAVAAAGTRFNLVASDPAAVYGDLLRNLRVDEAGRESGVVRVSMTDTSPRFLTSFLNALTAAYLDHDRTVRSSEATRSLEFLDSQLPNVKRELDRAEESLDRYRTGTNTVNLGQETESALRRIGELEQQRTEVQMKRDQLVQRFTYEHPDAIAMQRQLGTIAGELTTLRGRLRQAPRQEKDMVRLQRDVQVNTQLYTALLNNAQELRVLQAGMSGGARLIDPAGVTADPVRPQPMAVMSVAGGLGLVLALGGVTLACALRPTVRSAEELEGQIGLTTYAAIPESSRQHALMRSRSWFSRTRHRLLSLKSPAEPAIESLRGLRTSLALRHGEEQCATVLITAATANVGKSFIAANLAALTAATGRRVLLMDLDLRVPRIHQYLGLERDRAGLVDVLAQRCLLEEAIVRDVLPGLDVLLPGRHSDIPGELLLSSRFQTLLGQIEGLYENVIIDSAPVLPVSDTLAVARLAATTFLVVRSETSSLREVRDAVRRLEGAGAGVDGLLLNGVKRGRLATAPYSSYYDQQRGYSHAH